jgi:hypothetical protein
MMRAEEKPTGEKGCISCIRGTCRLPHFVSVPHPQLAFGLSTSFKMGFEGAALVPSKNEELLIQGRLTGPVNISGDNS